MANDVRASLRKEIDRLRRAISQKSTELKSLNEELKRCKGALDLLRNGIGRGVTRARRKRAKAGKSALVNWDSVLGQLPNSFTSKDITKRPESKGKAPVYLRQIVSRWAKQGKTKRVGLGKYQKVKQTKLRAA